jgi:FixJ family two-component response regulator
VFDIRRRRGALLLSELANQSPYEFGIRKREVWQILQLVHLPRFENNSLVPFTESLEREAALSQGGQLIYVVNDHPCFRQTLFELVAPLGANVVGFRTGSEYRRYKRTDSSACLIIDLMLPDISGIDLQQQLPRDTIPPVIFISDHADIPTAVRAMKGGAIDFLTKPVNPQAMLDAIDAAFAQDRLRRESHSRMAGVRERFRRLTHRERQVLPLITEGLLNKQAAAALGISEVTLQVHRGQIMRKMAATSFAELIRMAGKLGIPSET